MIGQAFQPGQAAEVNISVGTSSSTTSLARTLAASSVSGQASVPSFKSFRVANIGTDGVAIAFGGSGVTAALTDTRLLPNSVEVFTVNDDVTHIAAIGVAGGNTLQVQEGSGV